MIKILTGFTLEYCADILLRNFPDRQYGIKGKVKNFIRVFSDGRMIFDFFGDIFPRQPFSTRDISKATKILDNLSMAFSVLLQKEEKTPPYVGKVSNFIRFTFSDGQAYKFIFEEMESLSFAKMKEIVNAFLADFGLKLDIGERLPQGAVRYVGVVTEKSSKEYSYLWDGELEVGTEVLIPFGEENERVRGTVVSIEYYRTTRVPYPLERMKKIIRIENS